VGSLPPSAWGDLVRQILSLTDSIGISYESVDRDDLRYILYGHRSLAESANTIFHPKTNKLLQGLFESGHPSPGAAVFKERIHLVVAVHEETFHDHEIRQTMVLFFNPHFFERDNAPSFPLRWPKETEAPLRVGHPLWPERTER